jgi:peptidyl-prolyl cis-trans isomerase D
MLESIREGVKKPWVKIVIFAIVISFVFAGYFSSSFFLGDPNAVAIVNGESISRNEFQRAYANLKAQQAEYYNANVKTEEDERLFQENVLQRLITFKTTDQLKDELGMRLSTETLRNKIQSDPNYQMDGKYSAGLVEQALIRNQISKESFKNDYAGRETNRQLLSGVMETDFSLPVEVKSDYELATQKRSGRALQINFAQFKQNSAVSDEEIADYYQNNLEAFRVEEKVSVSYIELSIAQLQAEQQVSDEELEIYYQENLERYRSDAQRQVSHILILDKGDTAKAKAKIESIKARIDVGEEFATIASNESDDVPTRETGGDLGILIPGAMEEAFENAANALTEVGAVSPPVKSEFGYHLIQLTALTEGSVQTLAQVKNELLSELQKAKAEAVYHTKAEQLERLAFEIADSLEEAAKQTGLEVKTSELFGQSTLKGLFANEGVKTAAFSSDVKDAGLNSAPINIGDNHLMVLRVKEKVPSTIQPLESVKDRVVNSLKQSKAKQAASELAESLYAKLRAKESIDALLTENQLQWVDLDKIERNNASLSYLTNQQFFKMAAPQAGEVTLEKVEDFQGYTILMLNSVVNGNWAAADEASQKQRALYISSYYANAGFTAFIEAQRKNSDVTRNLNNLP